MVMTLTLVVPIIVQVRDKVWEETSTKDKTITLRIHFFPTKLEKIRIIRVISIKREKTLNYAVRSSRREL